MTIPKILHQTWKTDVIPGEFLPFVEKLKKLHPRWEYRLWTDESARDFVCVNYPELISIYDDMPRNIMRADVIRYLVLNQVGGLYLDLDYEVLRPLDACLEGYQLILPKNRNENEPSMHGLWHLGNALMASVPRHPFWGVVIESLKNNPPIAVGDQPDVEALTGPAFLTSLAQAMDLEDGWEGTWLAPRTLFHAIPPYRNPEPALALNEHSYGIHHCYGTWRPTPPPPPLWKRIVSKIRRSIQPEP